MVGEGAGVEDGVAVAVLDPVPDKLPTLGDTTDEKLGLLEDDSVLERVTEVEREIELDPLPVADGVAVAVVDGVRESDNEGAAVNEGEAEGLVEADFELPYDADVLIVPDGDGV